MIAAELLAKNFIPVQVEDTGRSALIVMNDQYVKHLPVLNNGKFIGVISEEELLNNPLDNSLSEIVQTGFNSTLSLSDHLFTILGKFAESQRTMIPVISENNKYEGALILEEVMDYYSRSFTFLDPGSIIVMTMPFGDYSLSNISRIIESEGGHVLCSFISRDVKEQQVYLTLKIDKLEIQKITASLRRMGYIIQSTYLESEHIENLQERYDALMHYLNL